MHRDNTHLRWSGPVDAPAAFLEAFKNDAAFLQVYAFRLCSS